MKFNLTKPCPKCPFRSDIPGYLTTHRAREIAASFVHGNASFPCHATLDYDSVEDMDMEGEAKETPNTAMCAGALILSEREAPGANQMVRIAERLGMYDYTKLDMSAPVFETIQDMVKHHGERQESEE